MPEFDMKGNIFKVFPEDSITKGKSICVECGKIMPICWDVICKKCNGAFCYDHAKIKKGYWFCIDCYKGGKMTDINDHKKLVSEVKQLRKLKSAVLEMADIYRSAGHIKAGSVGKLWKKILKLASE